MSNKVEISLLACSGVDSNTRSEVGEVFRQSFLVHGDADRVLDPYFRNVRCIYVARERSSGPVIGFQFYQEVRVDGKSIHHFSLSGRKDGFRGVQHKFGKHALLRALRSAPPWRPIYLAGVTNDPRSYKNMHVIGGRSYPRMCGASENCFGDWYFSVASRLGMEGLDTRGLVHDRMRKIGFGLREYVIREGSPLLKAYDEYIGGNRETGVFCLVEVVPLRDLPGYFIRRVMTMLGKRGSW
mgnify:CR=1 FL=1